mmetsp:Transcript_34621/g.107045  ORF Transcript_34621/g.107045 Transcript_34621/m.107045 type:complete len:208 (-) Transcript_34621:646-1269(-)
MNSKMPSDAAISTRSLAPILCSSSSGSATTPSDSASESPMDRVNAVPGYSWSCAQIRGGSPPSSISSPRLQSQFSWIGSTPSIWSAVMTRAPYFLTRSRSSRRYGVWSVDSARAVSLPLASTVPSMTRLSPTFETSRSRPSRYMVTAVVPDCWSSMGDAASARFVVTCERLMACCLDAPALSCLENSLATCSHANAEHFSPTGPWPS